jgi:hypothetical protein
MAKRLITWTVYMIVFTLAIVVLLHGGIFLFIPAIIVWRLVKAGRNGARRHRKNAEARTESASFNPTSPYDSV